MFRRMLKQQMELVRDGGEPMNVFRNPAKNVAVKVPTGRPTWGKVPDGREEGTYRERYHQGYIADDVDRYCPDKDVVMDLMAKLAEAVAAGR